MVPSNRTKTMAINKKMCVRITQGTSSNYKCLASISKVFIIAELVQMHG